ncbi:MAG: ABC transporter ATP-binding protein [Anaerolineales bacterium]
MQNNAVLVSVQNLVKKFGKFTAVENISFEIKAGEVFGILGPNGAGKTTTVRMLCALIAPSSGNAHVAGYVLGKQDSLIRKNVGILTESPGLYDALSAEDNLRFFAEMYEVPNVSAQVERYLRLLGLWERRFEPVGTFSKGMRQKLAIARSILHEPQLLFLDEPTSGLDPEMSRLVRDFISELKNEGRTIVLCTHNLDEADRLCDRIAVIKARLLALDTPKALRQKLYGRASVFHLKQIQEPYQTKIESLPFVQKVQTVDNKIVVHLDEPETHNPEIIRQLVELGADIQFVGEVRRTLEDVYLQLMNVSRENLS